MLKKPVLAKCDNRSIEAKKHPFSGEPEEWLADNFLEAYGIIGLSFDFFVNWKEGSIPNQLWIKRIVDDSFNPWPIQQDELVQSEIYKCDGEKKLKQLCNFADRYDMTCHVITFYSKTLLLLGFTQYLFLR